MNNPKKPRTPLEVAAELVAELDLVMLAAKPGAPKGTVDGRHCDKIRRLQDEFRKLHTADSFMEADLTHDGYVAGVEASAQYLERQADWSPPDGIIDELRKLKDPGVVIK